MPARQQLRQLLEHGDLEPAGGKHVRHFHSDVAGADDDRFARFIFEDIFDGGTVAELAQHLDPGKVEPGQGKAHGAPACGEHEGIEGLVQLPVVFEILDRDGAAVEVDSSDIVTESEVDAAL